MRRARWKRKNVRDELTALSVNSPKTRAGRHALPTKSRSLLPAALYPILKSVRPRICGHGAHRVANWTPPAHLSAAAPRPLGGWFPKGRPCPRPPSLWERVSKGRGPQPSPFAPKAPSPCPDMGMSPCGNREIWNALLWNKNQKRQGGRSARPVWRFGMERRFT